jgi:hypothetical protein
MGIATHWGSVGAARACASISFNTTVGESGTANGVIYSTRHNPTIGESIVIYDTNGQAVWGGTVDKIDTQRIGTSSERSYAFSAVSWEQMFSRRKCIVKVYSGLNAGDILADILGTSMVGDVYDIGVIMDGAAAADLGIINYSGWLVKEAFDDLASRSGYIWFQDADRKVYFVPRTSATLTDLVIDQSRKNYRFPVVTEIRTDYYNKGSIAISWDAFDTLEKEVVGDGVTTQWEVDFPIDNVEKIEINGVEADFGIQDEDSERQFYYLKGGTTIYQEELDPVLQSTDTLTIYYNKVHGNVISYEATADIAARQTLEGGSGVYESPLIEDLAITDPAVGLSKIESHIRRNNPWMNGAPAGTLPKEYKFIFSSYEIDAHQLVAGAMINVEWVNPSTGGAKNLLVQTVNGTLKGYSYFDKNSSSNEDSGWFEYEVRAVEWVPLQTGVDFFRSLAGLPPSNVPLVGAPTLPGAPSQLTDGQWSVAVTTYGPDASGKQVAGLRVTIPALTTNAEHFTVWTYEGADPPTDPSQYIPGPSKLKSPSGATEIDWWVDQEDMAYQVIVTANTSLYTQFPTVGMVPKEVVIEEVGPSPQVTDFSVSVETEDRGGVPSGRFVYTFTKPSSPLYFYNRIERVRCNSAFTPLPGEIFRLVASPVEPEEQEWWSLPSEPEYWFFRSIAVTRAEVWNMDDQPLDTVTVPPSSGIGSIIPDPLTSAGWSVSIAAAGLNHEGEDVANLAITITERPANTQYFILYGYKGSVPPTDPSQWEFIANKSISDAGITLWNDVWIDRDPLANYTLHLAIVTAATTHATPDLSTPVKSIVIPRPEAAAVPTGFGVTVQTEHRGGVASGRFVYTFTPPSTIGYYYTLIERIRCNSGFVPLPGEIWRRVANPVRPEDQEWWTLPVDTEYWQFRASTVTRSEIGSGYTPSVNVTVIGNSGLDLRMVNAGTLGRGVGTSEDGLTSTHPNPSNILSNPDFEFGLRDWEASPTAAPTDSVAIVTPSIAITASANGGVWTPESIIVKEGEQYVLSSWLYKAPGSTDSGSYLLVRFFADQEAGPHGDNPNPTFDNFIPASINSTGWTKASTQILTVPPGAKVMHVFPLWLPGAFTGTYYVDSTELRRVYDASVVSTVDAGKILSTTIAAHLQVLSGVLGVKPDGITRDLVNAFAIGPDELDNLAATVNKIGNFAVTFAKLDNAAVGNIKLDRASANKIAIADADVVNLSAFKVTAGTLGVGVVYAGTLNANQVNAGLLNGVRFTFAVNDVSVIFDPQLIDGSYGVYIYKTSTGADVLTLKPGIISFNNSTVSGTRARLDSVSGTYDFYHPTIIGRRQVSLHTNTGGFGGRIQIFDANGTLGVLLLGGTTSSQSRIDVAEVSTSKISMQSSIAGGATPASSLYRIPVGNSAGTVVGYLHVMAV